MLTAYFCCPKVETLQFRSKLRLALARFNPKTAEIVCQISLECYYAETTSFMYLYFQTHIITSFEAHSFQRAAMLSSDTRFYCLITVVALPPPCSFFTGRHILLLWAFAPDTKFLFFFFKVTIMC